MINGVLVMDYNSLLESYTIDTEDVALEYLVSYDQKYDENHKSEKKAKLSDYDVVELTAANWKSQAAKIKMKTGLLFGNHFKGERANLKEVHVVDKETHKSVCIAEIYPYEEYKKLFAEYKGVNPKDGATPGAFLNDLTVKKELQGQGLGTQICKMLISKYNIRYLETFKDGEVSRKLYDKLGFKTYHIAENGTHLMKR